MSADGDDELRAELLRFEIALATRDDRAAGVPLSALIDDDFVEFGASGATWDAATIRSLLDVEPNAGVVALTDFEVHRLSDEVALVTYRVGSPRPTNRSSVWVRRDGRWAVRFHQGTPLPG